MIGVFDSGIGGLSILRALRAELPGERFVYIADSGHAPYGERDASHVKARARALTRHLVDQGAQALVVACNTATAAAIGLLREEFPSLPIVGVEPAIKPAVASSRSGTVGVMATRVTLASDKFAQLLSSLQGQGHFVLQACDGLADAIERSVEGTAVSEARLDALCAQHVAALRAAPGGAAIDTVVLGCTHYPLVADRLSQRLGQGVQLLDPGEAVARQTRTRLMAVRSEARPATPSSAEGGLVFCTTGDAEQLARAARRWISPQATAQALHLD